MKIRPTKLLLLVPVLALTAVPAAAADAPSVAHGRYLVTIGGCNDCHTPGYAESGGRTPEAEWLTGSPVGFQGPWGTTYPTNLRLTVHAMTEAQWITLARSNLRPPMPSPSLHAMSETDLRSLYRYIRHLGAKGQPAPAYAPPGQAVTTPYYEFVPKNLPHQAQADH